MKRKDKMTVLVLMIVLTIGYGGCAVQIGRTNQYYNGKGNQELGKTETYKERLMSGKVSIEESIKRANDRQN